MDVSDPKWEKVSDNYLQERESTSFVSLLLDDPILEAVKEIRPARLLDYGGGSGTLARLCSKTVPEVIVYEPVAAMRKVLHKLTPPEDYPQIRVVAEEEMLLSSSGMLDCIVCINVLDHVASPAHVLELFQKLLAKDGTLLLCLPHPLKNDGTWVKSQDPLGQWQYEHYRLDGYMEEKVVSRNREDRNGNAIVTVDSFHRRISTYFNLLVQAGFEVLHMSEPGPPPTAKENHAVLYAKCSRIPYFLIYFCRPAIL